MNARYSGWCKICRRKYSVGTEIIKDKDGKWVHAVCPDDTSSAYVPAAKQVAASAATRSSNVSTLSVLDIVGEQDHQDDRPDFKPTPHQQAVFDFITQGKGHAVIEAVAGSGKTTTIVSALDLTPSDASVAFVAFNKHIVAELKKRAPSHVHVSTLHSLGMAAIRNSVKGASIDSDGDKLDTIFEERWPVIYAKVKDGLITKQERTTNFQKRYAMRQLVSISKAILVDPKDRLAVEHTADTYGIEVDDSHRDEIFSALPAVLDACRNNMALIDFDDMIWLPIINDLPMPKFDWLFVDEGQDMNKSQTEMILRSVSKKGRIIIVGDRHQSLYGFRGADVSAIPSMIERLKATVLPLSVTFRCPTSHVELAQKIVPQITAREDAPEGILGEVNYYDLVKKLQLGDMVICRTNAPLVKPAFECIRAGKKAIIRGKEVGSSLINMIKRFKTDDLGAFEVALAEYYQTEYKRLMDKGKDYAAALLQDKVITLQFIVKECSTVSELSGKIDLLFSDNSIGVVFSSVHRAKGLEAETVYILNPEQFPHPKATDLQQEANCLYVAQTRSKHALYFVEGGENI